MNIIILGPAYPYRGGPATFNNRLALQLASEGHNVKVVTFTLQYPGILFPGKTQFTDAPAPEGIEISRKLNTINPFNWIITGYKIKRERPDILLVRFWLPFMGPSIGTVARIVRSNKYTKVICIFDNVIPHEKRPGDRLLTHYFVNSIDGAIVMSGTVYDELKCFSNNLAVKLTPHPLFDNYGLPTGQSEALSILNLDPDYSYLLFFGFIRAYKGLDLLIEAFSDGRLRNKKLRLIVAGEFYDDRMLYLNLINRYNLKDDIIFFDHFIKDSDVSLFFSSASLIVQPYRSATQSGVTQIAFHFEKPILVTDVGGLSEIVTDKKSGYVVKPEPENIADAILDYFENNRQSQFINEVRKEKEKFSWDKMTATIQDIYKSLTL